MRWRTALKQRLAIGVGCLLTFLVTAGCKTAGGAGIGAIAGNAGMGAAIGAGAGLIGDILD